MKKFAVIVAGGSGIRMGGNMPKQFLEINGKPLIWYAINSFVQAFADINIILVLPKPFFKIGEDVVSNFTLENLIQIVEGGATRFNSVQNGLALVEPNSIVFVHDAVRCLVTLKLIQTCADQAMLKGSAIPAIAAIDSLRVTTSNLESTVLNREIVRIIQTPQTFKSDVLLAAFKQPFNSSFTDEATVVEANGEPVFLIEGEYTNIKITRPIDLIVAEQILKGLH